MLKFNGMKKVFSVFFLICLIFSAKAQFSVTQNVGSSNTLNVTKGAARADSGIIIPNLSDTAYAVKVKYYAGAIIRTGDQYWFRDSLAQRWLPLNGGLDSTDFEPVIDSTGQANYRVLFAVGNRIYGSNKLIYDSVNSLLRINFYATLASSFDLGVGGRSYFGGKVRLSDVSQQTDTTTYKLLAWQSPQGDIVVLDRWPSGSGGSGSVEYVVSGASILVDSSGRTYTVNADTGRGNSQLITGASLNSVADSLGDLIDLKPDDADVILNQDAYQTDKRFSIRSARLDSLYGRTATGLVITNNAGATAMRVGAGGGTTVGFDGSVNIDGTTRLATSLTGLLTSNSGTVSNAVSGTDIKTINSTSLLGSGNISLVPIDSVAVLRHGFAANNYRGWNAGLLLAGAVGSSGATSDSANMALGYNAGLSTNSGYRNIFLGPLSGVNNTTGHHNFYAGFGAGNTATTGDNNIAIGRLAYGSTGVKTGQYNVAIGFEPLRLSSTVNQAVAIGYRALGSATVTSGANHSIAIGTNALLNITSGASNVVIGEQSASTNLSATSTGNTHVGTLAGSVTATLLKTSFFGYGSGNGSSGANNSGIGYNSMRNATGANNVGLGAYSGDNGGASGGITGEDNIAIGVGAKMISQSANNQVSVWVGAAASGGTIGQGGYNVLSRNSSGQWIFNQTTSEVTTIGSGAYVEINGTGGGLLIPRLTGAEQNAIASPATGLLIFNTDTVGYTYYTGSAWIKVSGSGGSGITSLNGLTGATQTFTTGTTGTDFGISSSGTTHTFNLPTASATNRGALSTADWSTFNGKQSPPTWTDYSGTSTVVGWSSFTTKVIRYSQSGKQMTVNYYIEGTSDATSITFTLPTAIGASGVTPLQGLTFAINNGSSAIAQFSLSGSTVTLNRFNAIGATTTWTNSGTKRAAGTFTYEID